MRMIEVLREAGLRVKVGRNLRRITVEKGGHRASFMSLRRERAPYPKEIKDLEERRRELSQVAIPLLLAPYISAHLGDRLVQAGWSWADDSGNWDLRAPGLLIQRRISYVPPRLRVRRLPAGGGSLAIIRWLIHLAPGAATATELASHACVSRPRASQVLAGLVELGLVDHPGRSAWRAKKEALLDRFVTDYRGPGGTSRYFYTLQSPGEAAVALMSMHGRRSRVWISGDFAADVLAPLRRPTLLVVYTMDADMKRPGDWVEASGPGDGNILVVSPADKSIASCQLEREHRGTILHLVDPTQILWDLHRLGGDDRIEAAEEMRTWILSSRSVN